MNKRIKELAQQAGATIMERSGGTDYGTLDLDVEKFAELIIAECGIIFSETDGDMNGTYRDQIKEHFGIE